MEEIQGAGEARTAAPGAPSRWRRGDPRLGVSRCTIRSDSPKSTDRAGAAPRGCSSDGALPARMSSRQLTRRPAGGSRAVLGGARLPESGSAPEAHRRSEGDSRVGSPREPQRSGAGFGAGSWLLGNGGSRVRQRPSPRPARAPRRADTRCSRARAPGRGSALPTAPAAQRPAASSSTTRAATDASARATPRGVPATTPRHWGFAGSPRAVMPPWWLLLGVESRARTSPRTRTKPPHEAVGIGVEGDRYLQPLQVCARGMRVSTAPAGFLILGAAASGSARQAIDSPRCARSMKI